MHIFRHGSAVGKRFDSVQSKAQNQNSSSKYSSLKLLGVLGWNSENDLRCVVLGSSSRIPIVAQVNFSYRIPLIPSQVVKGLMIQNSSGHQSANDASQPCYSFEEIKLIRSGTIHHEL